MPMENLRETLRFAPLATLGEEISKIQDGGSAAIITDMNVADLYLEPCMDSLKASGFQVFTYVITPGEESKNGTLYLSLLNALAEAELTRTDGIVALGGGVVGDIAGFVSGTYLRGINLYQVPTTLLAMVDSAIGGKSGINLEEGKNLAGVFHMPKLILQDDEFITSLPDEEIKNGIAEVIKYGILKGGELMEKIRPDENGEVAIGKIIKECAGYKMEVVVADPLDKGPRQLLNLGHTIGHAVERLSNYEIKHGIAVAKGLSYIAELSAKQGWCDTEVPQMINELLDIWGLDTLVPYSGEELFKCIVNDKKRKSDEIDLIVPSEIGHCEIKRLSIDELGRILTSQSM